MALFAKAASSDSVGARHRLKKKINSTDSNSTEARVISNINNTNRSDSYLVLQEVQTFYGMGLCQGLHYLFLSITKIEILACWEIGGINVLH